MHNAWVFIFIVLVVYVGVNVFLFIQTRPLFSINVIGVWLKILFIVLASSFVLSIVADRFLGNVLVGIIERLGAIWLAAMLYLSLIFVLLLCIRWANHWLNFTSLLCFRHNVMYHRGFVIGVYALLFVILAIGNYNATHAKVVNLAISIDKPVGNLRIVAVSDIHLGNIIGNKQLNKLVNTINQQNPDVVLFVGDIFDKEVAPVINQKMGEQFKNIRSRYGVFAVPGNHDYFNDYQQKLGYLRASGITLLCDSVAQVSNYYIVGRNDRESEYALQHRRSTVEQLVQNLDCSKAIVLLDHQPYQLAEAQRCGVDLQISGHTHNGQLWPFSLITSSLFELSCGFMQKGKTNYYVTSGYGTWGPRFRIGSRAEVLVVEMKGK